MVIVPERFIDNINVVILFDVVLPDTFKDDINVVTPLNFDLDVPDIDK